MVVNESTYSDLYFHMFFFLYSMCVWFKDGKKFDSYSNLFPLFVSKIHSCINEYH